MSVSVSRSALPVFVAGSRRASPACVAGAVRLGVALGSSPLVSSLFVGCAGGVDLSVLSGWCSVRGVSGAVVFAVGGASGAGFWGGVLPPVLGSFAASGGSVAWWSGGSARSFSLSARLARRSSAAVGSAVGSGAAFGVWLVSSPASRGSFRSLAVAASLGLPVFAVPFGFSVLPSVGSGRWLPSSFLGGSFFLSENEEIEEPREDNKIDYLSIDLELPDWYKDFSTFTPSEHDIRNTGRVAGANLHHIVWITKYRKELLYGRLKDTIETAIRFKAVQYQVEITQMDIQPDHVHIIANLPKNLSLSKLLQGMKGLSSRVAKLEHPELMALLNVDEALWAKRYFSCSVGAGSRSKVEEYVANQSYQLAE